MSCQSPPTLQELAEDSFLRDPVLAISDLDRVPSYFFPSLFKKACSRRCISIMMAMVRVWPFPCLPLGAMIMRSRAYKKILEIILFELDDLLLQKVFHSRCRLKVLDLRFMPLKMWDKWSVFMTSDWSENPAGVDHSGTEVKPLVKVVIDLVLKSDSVDTIASFVVKWVGRRKGLMSLCCGHLQIWSMSAKYHREVLEILDLDSIQKLSLYYMNNTTCLFSFSPYLGRMRHLRSLLLCHLSGPGFFLTPVEKQRIITQFTSQFVNLTHLRSLHLHNVFFLRGHLDELFWWLKSPLETLLVTKCFLSKSDWTHMCEFLCASQLKHLILKWTILTNFSPEPLRVLLLKTASTLITLDLEGCQLMDSQLNAILPALRHCTQLTRLNFYGNSLSSCDLEGVDITRSG
ncbi:preferentially expressed antigen in melanoma-like protein 1 [Peromyscus leucopus]|uniref:preferentially expressed antigen in melanoma-like protein 1 n=1 Tax=Peromyscus leucopus TaxID=10041 RepID=UPI0018853920|nr:preferentially expressed antigen in melanoma-like protein 1 [Peromyscus leucopus]